MFKGLGNALLGILAGVILLDVLVIFCYNQVAARLDKLIELAKKE